MKDAEKEIPNVSKLVTNGALNKKVREVENKITAVGILVTTSVLTLIRLRFLRVFFFFGRVQFNYPIIFQEELT